jgi:hypothetical protein
MAVGTPTLAGAWIDEDAPDGARIIKVTSTGATPVNVYQIQASRAVGHELLNRLSKRLHAHGFVGDLNGQHDRITLIASAGDPEDLARALKPGLVEVAAVLAEPAALALLDAGAPPGSLVRYDASDPKKMWAVSSSESLAFELPSVTVGLVPETRAPMLRLKMSARTAAAFGDLTGRLVGRKMAVMVDGVVYMAPLVMERISGGEVQITLPYDDMSPARLASAIDGGPITHGLKLTHSWAGHRTDMGGRTRVKPDKPGAGNEVLYGTPARWELTACDLSGQPTCRISSSMVLGQR